jgi:hypothetical protein
MSMNKEVMLAVEAISAAAAILEHLPYSAY